MQKAGGKWRQGLEVGDVVINNRVGNIVSFGKSAWEPL